MSRMRKPRTPTRPRNTHLGAWLTELRLNLQLCEDQVAAALDVNPGRICEFETGQRYPDADELEQLLRFYGQLSG